MTAISFTEWQAGRRHVPDLLAEIKDDCVEGPGFVYPGGFYINDNTDPSIAGKYRLLLERDEYYTDDLQELEQRLYDWAKPDDPDTLASLTAEYVGWCNENGDPGAGSADELLADVMVKRDRLRAQDAWLRTFIHRWEEASTAERKSP